MDIESIHQEILKRRTRYLKFITIANKSTDNLQIMMARFKVKFILPQIDRILQKISAGSYGICTECGEKIPYERMRLVSLADRCFECQMIEEKKRFFKKEYHI